MGPIRKPWRPSEYASGEVIRNWTHFNSDSAREWLYSGDEIEVTVAAQKRELVLSTECRSKDRSARSVFAAADGC